MRKRIFTVLMCLFFVSISSAQSSELTLKNEVKPHKGVDAIYKTFSESYRTLKPKMVANLYTEDAAYLVPNNDITNGRKEILNNFINFFNSIKNRGLNMTISFEIYQRRVTKKMGYDVGIYTINFYKEEKFTNVSKGKFVVVAVKGKDKKWRFQVDGYSGLKPKTKK